MLLPLRLLLPDFSYQGLSSKVDFYRNQNLFFFLHQELVPNLADDPFLPMVCRLVGEAVQGATPMRFLAGWTAFRRNPRAHWVLPRYNLPWWAPSSSCSSASATALDMAVAILMWCSSGWCSIPCSCIGSYLSSLVVDACYSRVCRLSSCLVSIIGVPAMIWFTCGCPGRIAMLLDLLNWSIVFVLGRWWLTLTEISVPLNNRGTCGYQAGSSLLSLESFLNLCYLLFYPWMVILVE